MSTYKGHDGCTDIILDLIAEHLHYIRTKLMQQLLDHGQPSTAVGRYQIIRRTFQALQGALKLRDDVLFTPAVQDQMAVRLMVGRGYQAWWRGAMADDEFAHGLSCEWASLPDPDRGDASHYDGVGQNHAGTTLSHVYDALRRARVAIPKTLRQST